MIASGIGYVYLGQEVQIISLGCGLDTLWFNLAIDEKMAKHKFSYLELDLPNVVKRKVKKIQHSKKIMELFNKIGDNLQVSGICVCYKCRKQRCSNVRKSL